MNKETINIDGQTYVKQGSKAEPSSAPSALKITGAKILTQVIMLSLFVPALLIVCKIGLSMGIKGDFTFMLVFAILMFASRLLAVFIATKIFGESVMRAIPTDFGNSHQPVSGMDMPKSDIHFDADYSSMSSNIRNR